ncbi:MAG: hypothetical protein ACJAT1_001252 [Marivirga sp.]|jgi:hypothetical protein
MHMDLIDNPQLQNILAFITQNQQENPAQLLLSNKIPEDFPKQAIAEQIASRQKAKAKLPDLYNNKSILFPPSISMEQCSSEATALFKASLIEGAYLTDLTGGFGIDTLYLSEHFDKTNYVEHNDQLCALAAYNFQILHKDNINVHHADAHTFLEGMAKGDCIYIDPARRDKNNQKVFGWEDCQPNLMALLPKLLSKAKTVLAKAAPMLDISQAILQLNGFVKEVYIVEWKGEVRELLFNISDQKFTDPAIMAIILDKSGAVQHRFEASMESEKKNATRIAQPKEYLYEPSPALMKSGFYTTLSTRYGLEKLHQNTQLFTANELIPQFPGKTYHINSIIAPQKKLLQEQLQSMHANLKCRNFPMDINVLKKKLGLKDGGSNYLFATTLADSSKRLLICKKVDE